MCILINHHYYCHYYYYYYCHYYCYYYYFSAFDHTSLHGEGNENVSSYQNVSLFVCCRFFFKLSRFSFLPLEMANIGELPYGVVGTAPKFGLRKEIVLYYVYVPQTTSQKEI